MAAITIATAPTAIRSAPCRRLCGITMSSTAATTTTTTRSTNGHSTVFQCGLRIRTVRSPSDRSASAMCTWWHTAPLAPLAGGRPWGASLASGKRVLAAGTPQRRRGALCGVRPGDCGATLIVVDRRVFSSGGPYMYHVAGGDHGRTARGAHLEPARPVHPGRGPGDRFGA